MKIASIMSAALALAGPDAEFMDLLRAMRDRPSRLLYIVDEEKRLLGVISSYDIMKMMLPFYVNSNLARAMTDDEEFICRIMEESRSKTARDVMATDHASLREDDSVLEAEALFKEQAVNALPVLDASGRLTGEVIRGAVLNHFTNLLEKFCKTPR